MWMSEGNHVDPGVSTQDPVAGSGHLYLWSHVANPCFFFFCFVFVFYKFSQSVIIALFYEKHQNASNKFSSKNIFALKIRLFLFKRLIRMFIIVLNLLGRCRLLSVLSRTLSSLSVLDLVLFYHCAQLVVHPHQLSHLLELT